MQRRCISNGCCTGYCIAILNKNHSEFRVNRSEYRLMMMSSFKTLLVHEQVSRKVRLFRELKSTHKFILVLTTNWTMKFLMLFAPMLCLCHFPTMFSSFRSVEPINSRSSCYASQIDCTFPNNESECSESNDVLPSPLTHSLDLSISAMNPKQKGNGKWLTLASLQI
jgi:hypothetical protein